MAERTYDVVVIGAGPTGENVAARAVKGGLSAAIIEVELAGGECSYWACMPSKALLRPVQALTAARSVAGSREAANGRLDVAAIFNRRDSFTSHWDDAGQVKWLRDNRVDFFRGHGALTGERRVRVINDSGETDLIARHAVAVCTGTGAAIPPVPGLAAARPWTSREATSARAAPRRLAVLGGGIVGCEMATAWRQLGSDEITIVQQGPRLITGYEPFAGDLLRQAMETRGIRVLTNTTVKAVERSDGHGQVRVSLSNGEMLVADEILVATGRRPRTEHIGLETIGLAPGSWLEVDDTLRVGAVPGGWLYAAGDVNHRALLTHMGKYQGRICGDIIAARAAGRPEAAAPAPWTRYAATADHTAIPQVVFTDPEIAAVGLTEAQARQRGMVVRAVEYDIGRVAGASLYADGYAGRAHALIDEERRVIVGMTLIGPGVGELIHSATVAVVGEVPIDRLWHAVPSYPTISEVWLRLLEALGL